jgi:abortive infection bacteriophage resistance protein
LQNYTKPAVTFVDQLNLLKSRGLQVSDDQAALAALAAIGYYRLSAYWYPFRFVEADGTKSSNIQQVTSFDQIINLYERDRKLRLLVMDAIERVEIATRTRLTYHLSHTYGPFAQSQAANFHPQFRHTSWLTRVRGDTSRSSDKFIDHYKQNYHGFPDVPVWMLTEIITLGSLSRLYEGLLNRDKSAIASYFNINRHRLKDWLHVLTYVRNVCAHHGRLWNRSLAIRPQAINEPSWSPPNTLKSDRIFIVLLILRQLLVQIGNGEDWKRDVDALLEQYSAEPNFLDWMGVPATWKLHPLWA